VLTLDCIGQGLGLPAPGPASTDLPTPSLGLKSKECVRSNAGSCLVDRLHMAMTFPRSGFYGALNVTGNLLAWSFSPKTWPPGTDGVERVVRFAGAQGSEQWGFWVSRFLAGIKSLCLLGLPISVALQMLIRASTPCVGGHQCRREAASGACWCPRSR
jgi:hypothetical protein